MTDSVTVAVRSKIMSAVKSRDTKIEILFRKALWQRGIRYRKNVQKYLGKPDIVIKKHKIVIFIDSCFWHGHPQKCRLPSSNAGYWTKKISRNREHDKEVTSWYKSNGWTVFRFWDYQIEKNIASCIKKIKLKTGV
jgi:DNA mismatch endonuclease (patch repair protein)